ncbi:MAG TPA: cytochrome c peroxidase [Candidatus Krumholzibacteria bacterium]|nr:cytochrome c peroxidase [Candidatus Krumholzibacteria bacterium]
MKLHRLTLWVCVALAFAACSKNSSDSVTPPDQKSDCPPPTPVTIQVPPGFPQMPQPKDNPLTREGIELGRLLFYDPVLSGDSTLACGGCHIRDRAFSDSRPVSKGIRGISGTRHAPTIVNPAWTGDTFWDGRAHGLEDQATQPVPNEIEMDIPWTEAVAKLKADPGYPSRFCAAFGDSNITKDRVVKAIAQFERTFVSFDSKYDRWKRGEATFDHADSVGYFIFQTEIGDCFHCHPEPLFSDACATCGVQIFHNTGLDSIPIDRGRFDVTGNPADMGKFKAPTLRNCAERFTFMHDSRFTDLHQVIDHYNLGFHDGDLVDPLIRARIPDPNAPPGKRRRLMREGEIDTLIIFLNTLTDPSFLTNPDLSNPYR